MSEKITFHFKGGVADDQQLPVESMIDLLSNLKELVYLIVSQAQGVAYNERFKPSKEIKKLFSVNCEVPQAGSYAMPVSFEYTGDELPLNPINPGEKIQQVMKWIEDEEEPKIVHLLPNPKMRIRALSCIRAALPKADSELYLEIAANDNDPAINSRDIQRKITPIIDKTQDVVEEHMTVVTGRLTSIDFEEKKIVINYPATRKNLECFYNEEIEDMLFENRRQLVQITGTVVFDDAEQPKKITDVVNIQEIDLSPIEIGTIDWGNKKLRLKDNIILNPQLDDAEQLYTINCPELGLDSFAYTRQELTEDVASDIVYLWEEYAQADDDSLSEDAKVLKYKLLDAVEEVE